jgi:hypothetical protein
VLAYFKTAAVPQSLLRDDQFRRVRAFQEKLSAEGLFGKYEQTGHLREQVLLHVTKVVVSLFERERGQPSPGQGRDSILTAPRPRLRVVIFAAGTIAPTPGVAHLLGIKVENHSPVVVYVSGISILASDNRALLLITDAATSTHQTRIALLGIGARWVLSPI